MGEGRAKGRVRLLRTRGSADLGKVASSSAMQGLWLGERKVGSQVIDEDRGRLYGRRTVGEVRRGGRRSSDRTKEYTDLGLDLGEREEQVACYASALAIFITSVSGSKSLASFTNRFFHFSGPSGFRRAFDAAKRNGRFGRIQCQKSKESSSRGKRRVFLCRTVRVKVKGRVILASFLKIEGWGTPVGAKDRRKRNR